MQGRLGWALTTTMMIACRPAVQDAAPEPPATPPTAMDLNSAVEVDILPRTAPRPIIPSPAPSPAPSRAASFEALAPGTSAETDVFLIVGSEPGPKVMVVAGIHGDEPAAPAAAEMLLYWSIERGRMYVVPRANTRAIASNTRLAPTKRHRDLNRNFPLHEHDTPRGLVASEIWDLTVRIQPDVVVDLHEGFDFNRTNPKSVGSSILFNSRPDSEARAEKLVETVNRSIDKPWQHFTVLRRTAYGSLARAVTERLGAHGFIFETTKTRSLSVTARVGQHLLLLGELLDDLDMGPTRAPGLEAPESPLPPGDLPSVQVDEPRAETD